jgi:hypothetical protein
MFGLSYFKQQLFHRLPYTSWFNVLILIKICFQEPKHSTPVVVASGDATDLFSQMDILTLVTKVDGVETSHPMDIIQAVCSVLCLYWVYDIAYSKKLKKTLTFLASHVCKLEGAKANVAMQRRLNMLYSL